MVAYWHAREIDGGEEGTGMGDVHKSNSNILIFLIPLSIFSQHRRLMLRKYTPAD